MGHIHEQPGQHDLTVSGYIIRVDTEEPRMLLHMHKKLGKILQFGGHVELDENPWQAITHELLEESGYHLGQLQLLQPKDRIKNLPGAILHPQPVNLNTHKFNDGHSHTSIEYAFVTSEDPAEMIGKDESEDLRLLSLEEIIALKPEEVYPATKEICEYIFRVCLPKWETVPADQVT